MNRASTIPPSDRGPLTPANPTREDLLAAWERGAGQPSAVRALALAEATLGPVAVALAIGERERIMLTLRRTLFGPTLPCLATCPACGREVEFELEVDDIMLAPPARSRAVRRFRHAGRELRFRLPTAGDAAAATRAPSRTSRRASLLRACLIGDDEPDLPEAGIRRLERRIVDADAQAEIDLALACPDCSAAWTAPFDATEHVWAEVDAWAQRTLEDVHRLAAAYGWTESEVLSLSPARRQFYIAAVQS